MKESQLHYKSMFTLKFPPNVIEYDYWGKIVKKIGSWVFQKFSCEYDCTGIISSWLFTGGKWSPPNARLIKAETKIADLSNNPNLPPNYWAFRLEHPDNSFSHRIWRTDIALTYNENASLNVVIKIFFYISSGYIGPEPPLPTPTAPSIIKSLFILSNDNVFVGSQQLSRAPIEIRAGDGRDLVKRIIDKNRLCPIILIRPDLNNNINLNLIKLSKVLLGNAVIYFLSDNDEYSEIQYFTTGNFAQYNCPCNCVKIYQPQINYKNANDSKRHRFFKLDNRINTEELVKIIIQGVFRIYNIPFNDFVTCIEDIIWKEREHRISELRKTRSQQEDQEFISLLDLENKNLTTQSNLLKKQVHDFEEENITLQMEIDNSESIAKYQIDQLNQVIISQQKNQSQSNHPIQIYEIFRDLPTDLYSVLNKIGKIFEGRIVILQEAFESAREADFSDIHSSWELLWAMSTTLWELYFSEETDTANIITQFRCQSGYDLTLTESKLTKNDSRLMKQRLRQFNGKTIDITPHAKIDKIKSLRIHYYPDKIDKIIVIGHCGNHLETYGTKRRKEK
jgi:hypothetical protein